MCHIMKKIEKFFKIDKKDRVNVSERIFFTIFIIFLSWLIALSSTTLPKIILSHTNPNLKAAFFLIILLIAMFSYFIILFLGYKKGLGMKIVMLILITIVMFFYIETKPGSVGQILLGILPIFIATIFFFVLKKDWIKPNFWVIGTLLIMLFSFFAGTMVIEGFSGFGDRPDYHDPDRPISLYLNIEENGLNRYANNGTIECAGSKNKDKFYGKKILVNNKLTCEVKPSLNITEARVVFISKEETREIKNLTKDLTFVLPAGIVRFGFEIKGITQENESIFLATYADEKFYTYEEYNAINRNFLTYLFVLIGIILFSIPAMMVNFRKLAKPKE